MASPRWRLREFTARPPRRRRDARVDFRAGPDASPTSRVRIRLPCSIVKVRSADVTSMLEPGSRLVIWASQSSRAARASKARSATWNLANDNSTPYTRLRLGNCKNACNATFPVPHPKSYTEEARAASRCLASKALWTPRGSNSPYNNDPRSSVALLRSSSVTQTCPSVLWPVSCVRPP